MLWGGIDCLWNVMKPLDAILRFFFRSIFNRMKSGNRLVLGEKAAVRGKAFVTAGKGNLLQVGKGSQFQGIVHFHGSNNKILIGENCRYRGKIVVKGSNQTVSFGDKSTAHDVYIVCMEKCDVTIGKACMLSRKIEIRTSDAHSVIDRQTHKRLNRAAPVTIGDHVWVGVGSIINKGSTVPTDSIVGAMSFVNEKFTEEGVMLAGTPAKIVKRGITWNRSQKTKYESDQIYDWQS